MTPREHVNRRRANKMARIIGVGLAVFLGAAPAAGAAGPIERHEHIITVVRDFVVPQVTGTAGQTTVEVGPLDPRLRVPECGAPLDTFFPAGSQAAGNTTVGVRCRGPHPWLLYIPVTVRVMADVVVAARPLPMNTVISGTDVKVARRDLSRLTAGYFTRADEVAGKVVNRPVSLGTALTPLVLAAQTLVKRGQEVTILAKTGTMEVRMTGRALSDGAAGDTVRVRNLSSKRIVEGTVTAAGVVQVAL